MSEKEKEMASSSPMEVEGEHGSDIHSEIIPDYMNLHSSLPTQAGVIKKSIRDVPPVTSIESTGPIHFNILSASDELIHPSGIRMKLEVQVRDQNGNHIPLTIADPDPGAAAGSVVVNPKAKAFYVNGFAHSLFSDIEVWINDTKIASYDSMYAYKADLECRLFSTSANKKHSLKVCGFDSEQDPFDKYVTLGTVGEMVGINERLLPDLMRVNAGNKTSRVWNRRLAKCRASQTMHFEDKIYSEIFQQPKCLPPGAKLSVKFQRNRPEFCLLTNEDEQFTIHIVKCNLSVPFLKGNANFVKDILHQTYSGDLMRFPLRTMICNSHLYGGYARHKSIDNILNGAVTPRRIFVGLIRASAVSGHYKQDPFNYHHYNLEEIKCLLGGQLSNIPPIKCNYDVFDGELEAVTALLRTLGSEDSGEEIGIDNDNFRDRNNIYAFDINGLSGVELANAFTREEKMPTGLDFIFEEPIGSPVNIMVFKEYDSEIHINGAGEVKVLPYA